MSFYGAINGSYQWKQRRPVPAQLQSLAAIGQIELIQAYKKLFNKKIKDIQIGQVLLTNDDLVSRERYLNAKMHWTSY